MDKVAKLNVIDDDDEAGWYCMYRILNWAKAPHPEQSLLINFYQH